MNKKIICFFCMFSVVQAYSAMGNSQEPLTIGCNIILDQKLFEDRDSRKKIVDQMERSFNYINKCFRDFNLQMYAKGIQKKDIGNKLVLVKRVNNSIDIDLYIVLDKKTYGKALSNFNTIVLGINTDDIGNPAIRLFFLHEVAHLFGALDVLSPDTLMNGDTLYKSLTHSSAPVREQLCLDPENREAMLNGVETIKSGVRDYNWTHWPEDKATSMVNVHNRMVESTRYPESVYFEIASYYYNTGNFDHSLEYFTESLRIYNKKKFPSVYRDPKTIGSDEACPFLDIDQVRYSTAQCYIKRLEYNKALTVLEAIPDDSIYADEKYRRLAVSYHGLGDFEKSAFYTDPVMNGMLSPSTAPSSFFLDMGGGRGRIGR